MRAEVLKTPVQRRSAKDAMATLSLELKTSLDSITATAQFASLLINNCYYLQVLVLHLVDRDQISNTSTNSKVVAELPIYTSNKLKYIAVFGVEGLDCELELFQLLLHSAVNLEPIVIVWKNFEHYEKGLKSVPLQAFPTVS
ncbi:hypothetical protein Sjap_024565 [Stephania japonica]|uniref:FBD domain-containing protein n=1 Tax=Stephania japonica TaxID=461633 RepID=A0AAP0EKU4_9MAGN